METLYPLLFPLLVLGLVAWQVKKGQTFRMRWIPSVSKAEHTVAFWAIIAFQIIVGGFGTYEGFALTGTGAIAEDDGAPTVQMAGMAGGANVSLSATKSAPAPAPAPAAAPAAPSNP